MYIRYELYADGEYQGIGMFRGICELDKDDEILHNLTSNFDETLTVPIDVFVKYKETKSWFTETGFVVFANDIKRIADAYDNTGLFELKRIDAADLDDIIYQDEYQVIQRIA